MPKAPKKFKPVVSTRPASAHQQQRQQQQQQKPEGYKQKQHNPSQQHVKRNSSFYTDSSAAAYRHSARSGWQCASVIDQQSSEVLNKLLLAAETRKGGATIKSLTLAPHIVHKKPTFAVTCETLKHLPLLKQLVAEAGLLEQHQQQLSPAAAYVLTYEVLFGQGFRRKGPAEKAVLQHKDALQFSLQKLLQDAGVEDVAGWLQTQQQNQQDNQQQQQPAVQHPRHARVNLLKATVQDVLAQLQGSSGGYDVRVDELLPDLLVFPPGTDLHDHPLVEEGVLILQSKASCMPAHALQPNPGWHLVDCCAAPGNKTTHAAALLHAATAAAAAAAAGARRVPQPDLGSSKGSKKKRRRQDAGLDVVQGSNPVGDIRVFAFDKDPKRVKRLQANVEKAGAAGIVVAQRADFLSIDPLDPQYAQVKGVILDPSCSGSGTVVSRMDHLLPGSTAAGSSAELDEQEQQRVEQLAKFQEAALLHALPFPALQRIVYSTCSIHQRENEDVVAAVLPTATSAGFRLVDPFPKWHRRGLPVVEGAELLVRTDAHADGTDGFFVAVFERSVEQQQQQQQQQGEGAGQQQQQQQTGVEQQPQQQHQQEPQQGSRKKKKKLRHVDG